jgi:hypothetical protein
MQKKLFKFVSNASVFSLKVLDNIFALQQKIVNFIYQVTRAVFGKIGYSAMKAVDAKKVKLYENMIDSMGKSNVSLKNQQTELKLLGSAVTIRDHAMKTGDWTDHHSEALQAIGNNLQNEFKWEEDAIHQYFKEVVETIPGLDYGADD